MLLTDKTVKKDNHLENKYEGRKSSVCFWFPLLKEVESLGRVVVLLFSEVRNYGDSKAVLSLFLNTSPSLTGGDLEKRLKIIEQSTLNLCSGHSTTAVC